MNIKGNAVLHNRFDIVVYDAETMEEVQRGKAENIVLDRAYTRLCSFLSYFDNIVFGTGTGIPTPDRTTLFNRLGYKAATTEEVVRAYPTSRWVRKIRLDTLEFNGSIITEVGISDTTTNINTHALITDAEGNPLSIEKTDLRIVDIYATVFIEIPNVDSGLFWFSNGWRDYLTGGTAPTNDINVSTGVNDYGHVKTGTRTADAANKRVKIETRLGVDEFNNDIRFVGWLGAGLGVKLPRVGIWEGKQRNNVQIGVGDGVATKFSIPNMVITGLQITVDDVIQSSGWSLDALNNVIFDSPPAAGLIVKANYNSILIPKDINHVLDIAITLQYNNMGTLPMPIQPTPDFSNVPGSKVVIAGNSDYGFFGEVTAEELISGDALAALLGLTAGVSQNSNAGWLKAIDNGKMLLIAKQSLRHTISWNDINAVKAVFGRKVTIGGVNYIVRLFSSTEWDRFMYPLHVQFGQWAQYTDANLNVNTGNGRATWTSTPSGANRIYRGNGGVTISNNNTPSYAVPNNGFRPVLEVLL